MMSDNVPQAGNGELIYCPIIIRDLKNCFGCIGNPVPKHSIYSDCNTVLRNRFLLLKINCSGPDINHSLPVNKWNDPIEPRSFDRAESAKPEDDTSFVFLSNSKS